MKNTEKDDLLVIKSLDRLGRNYTEIQEEWRRITKKRGADIVVLDMPLLDTTQSQDLIGTLISDLVYRLFPKTNETTFCKGKRRGSPQRRRGVKFGRPAMKIPDNYAENY